MSPVENLLLAVVGGPVWIWLLWRLANFFVNLHDNRYERDVIKVKGERSRPMPHQQRERVR